LGNGVSVTNCDEIRDDIDLYALGTLDASEADRVRVHVALCDACRAELLAAEETAARLAFTVPRVAAPPAVRDAVFAAIHAGPRDEAHTTHRRSWPLLRPRALPAGRFGTLAAALLLIPIAGLLIWAVLLQRQVNSLRHDAAAMQRRADGLTLLAMPSSLRADFVPARDAGGAMGAVMWNPEKGLCAVLLDRLPRAEPGTAYRLWYRVDDRLTVDAGEIHPDEYGRAEIMIDTSRWRGSVYDMAVRVEHTPADPTAPALLTAQLRRP
jgi:hypothetical protein